MNRVHHKASHHEAASAADDGNGFAGSVQTVREGVAHLRDDLTDLAGNVVGAGKSGIEAAREAAESAVEGVKDQIGSLKKKGLQSAQAVERQLGDHVILTSLLAFAAGYVAAKLINRK
jgi:ElaB/YqjD/DUF883 family membrane-anchored ribosome-binding protein